MKEGIHPGYRDVCFVDLSNGFRFVTRSTAQTKETIKMDDGNNARACEVVMATLLEALVGAIGDDERALLVSLSNVTLRNRRGIEVGRLAAHDSLCQGVGRARRAQNRTAA